MKLNLGCGNETKQGYVNVDFFNNNCEVKHNLNNFPYPFESNSADEIIIKHVLEHLENPIKVLNECIRILKKEGKIIINVPHWSSYHAYSLQHKRGFSAFMLQPFIYNDKPEEEFNGKLKIIKTEYNSGRIGEILNPILNYNLKLTELFLCKFLPIYEIKIIAEKVD